MSTESKETPQLNYLWFKYNDRIIRVTIAFKNDEYAFSIQSPKDQFNKALGRNKAIGRLEGKSSPYKGDISNIQEKISPTNLGELWFYIKKDFLARANKGEHHFDSDGNRIGMPDFLRKSVVLSR